MSDPITALRIWRLTSYFIPVFHDSLENYYYNKEPLTSEVIKSKRKWSLFALSDKKLMWKPVMRAECSCNHTQEYPPDEKCMCGIYGIDAPEFDNFSSLYLWLDHKADIETRTEIDTANMLWNPLAYVTSAFPDDIVIGYVDLWGKVVEHENGYRAEYGQVKSLFLHDAIREDIVRGLTNQYECDIVRYAKW